MSTQLSVRELPTVADLAKDVSELAKNDSLLVLLNQDPPTEWIKKHPFINVKIGEQNGREVKAPLEYIPIDKQRFIAKRIFGGYNRHIISTQVMFQSVVVVVRIEVKNPITGEQISVDGIGAVGVQTDAGFSASDLTKIKQDAVMKAAPAAASYAEKNAWDQLGRLFGGEIQKDTVQFSADTSMYGAAVYDAEQFKEFEEPFKEALSNAKTIDDLRKIWENSPEFHANAEIKKLFTSAKIRLSYAK